MPGFLIFETGCKISSAKFYNQLNYPGMYTVSQLFIYPVKSLGGIEVTSARLTDRGFQYDRRWMLVDAQDQFLTQREHNGLSLLKTAFSACRLIIFDSLDPNDCISLSLQPALQPTRRIKVWDDECVLQSISPSADAWFSKKLGIACRLVYMPEHSRREVDKTYAQQQEITSLSDGYPLLMIGEASLEGLNNRLTQPLPMNRFRPNIVFSGGQPHDEDGMAEVRINGVHLFGVKLCARCMITTINQSSGSKGKEPLTTLARYRLLNNKIYFGQNVLADERGEIRVGDSLEVIRTRSSPFAISSNDEL